MIAVTDQHSNLSQDELDELLEQAAIQVAEGDFAGALPLLQTLQAQGDEIQQEMAAAYCEQIEEMGGVGEVSPVESIAEPIAKPTAKPIDEAVFAAPATSAIDQSLLEQPVAEALFTDSESPLTEDESAFLNEIDAGLDADSDDDSAFSPFLQQVDNKAEPELFSQEQANDAGSTLSSSLQTTASKVEKIEPELFSQENDVDSEPSPFLLDDGFLSELSDSETENAVVAGETEEIDENVDDSEKEATKFPEAVAAIAPVAPSIPSSADAFTDIGDRATQAQAIPGEQSPDKRHVAKQVDKQSVETPEYHEMNIALEQAALLIAEDEGETAELLLQPVLDAGDAEQQRMAKDYLQQIKFLETQVTQAQPTQAQASQAQSLKVQLPTDESAVNISTDEQNKQSDSMSEVEKLRTQLEKVHVNATKQAVHIDSETSEKTAGITVNGNLIKDAKPIKPKTTPTASPAPAVITGKPSPFTEQTESMLFADEPVEETTADLFTDLTTDALADSNNITKITEETTKIAKATGITQATKIGQTANNAVNPSLAAVSAQPSENLRPPSEMLLNDDAFIALNTQAQSLRIAGEDLHHRQGFLIGSLRLMIRYIDGSELTELPDLYHMPNAAKWLLGVTNLHGVIIPVFDLATYFGISSEKTRKPMLLILQHGENAAGIVIDGLPQRLTYTTEQEIDKSTAPSYVHAHTKSACLIDKEVWFDLDVDSLCQALEQRLVV